MGALEDADEDPNREESQLPVVDLDPVAAELPTTPLPKSVDDVRADGPGTDSAPLDQRSRESGPHFKVCFSMAEGANGDELSESFEVVPPGCMNENATFSLLAVPENHRFDPGKAGRPGRIEELVVIALGLTAGGVVLGGKNRFKAVEGSRGACSGDLHDSSPESEAESCSSRSRGVASPSNDLKRPWGKKEVPLGELGSISTSSSEST